ncbi:MAG: hypothetical protein KF699_16835 [Phycisphaeraceae bacterium]|nr:hypothetical protein [Phycisphaeraceae bacterium]
MITVTFHDLQRVDSCKNAMLVTDSQAIVDLFHSFNGRQPFMFELRGDNNKALTIGYASTSGVVQYSSQAGTPPYWMAVGDDTVDAHDYIEFAAGGTPTPVSRRYCLPLKTVLIIAMEFMNDGGMSRVVQWEQI